MSERKVLSKYYPPDFDPSQIGRSRGPKAPGPKVVTVRLMAPFSMKCTTCGEFIYKGRKFNARKEITDQKYLTVTIIRFYIRCTRCSAEITFVTDPRHHDFECERGAKRNFEPWRKAQLEEETEQELEERLEREEAEKDIMKELESKTVDAKTEMQIADALDEIRLRNARNERDWKDGEVSFVREEKDEERERQEREDEEAARRAFMGSEGEKVRRLTADSIIIDDNTAPESIAESSSSSMPPPPVPTFKRQIKKKKDFSAALGIKKKAPA
ncbi:DUF572-domain-containing protein [Aulographum hederae CBS 113979]|uniref:Splicing factor YJU2 n=1 Tax=Aulographum hederae CBS 113979 TaxID=1176131 RepID=A0A6G1H0A4_9PEZI|nr:DUF572-domain-containing protein [Aulographum hederae CBS 113979]